MAEPSALREYLIGQALAGLLASGGSGVRAVKEAIALADEVLAKLAAERPQPRRAFGETEERRKRRKDRRVR